MYEIESRSKIIGNDFLKFELQKYDILFYIKVALYRGMTVVLAKNLHRRQRANFFSCNPGCFRAKRESRSNDLWQHIRVQANR